MCPYRSPAKEQDVEIWELDQCKGAIVVTHALSAACFVIGAWYQAEGICQSCQDAGPERVASVSLQVEEGTPFARWYTAGKSPLPDEGQAVAMYQMASRILTAAGYEHYEVGGLNT